MTIEVLEQLSQMEEINFTNDYVVKFNGKEVTLEEYLAAKEEETFILFSK